MAGTNRPKNERIISLLEHSTCFQAFNSLNEQKRERLKRDKLLSPDCYTEFKYAVAKLTLKVGGRRSGTVKLKEKYGNGL